MLRRLLPVLGLLALIGCLAPEGPAKPGVSDKPEISDPVLLAGATSSTNWPPEDGGRTPILATGVPDSSLVIRFSKLLDPMPMSGMVYVYIAGHIPALDSIPELQIPFSSTESVSISIETILGRAKGGSDAVSLSIRIQTDSGECNFYGFEISQKSHKVIKSPFSEVSTSYAILFKAVSYVHAKVDASILSLGSTMGKKTGLCFYIPGSPYFWTFGSDSVIDLGPLPKGKYPIRYLRITQPDGANGTNRLEAFETEIIDIGVEPGGNKNLSLVRVGGKIASAEYSGTISLRSPLP